MDFANANTNAKIPKSVIKNVPRMLKYIKIKFKECEYKKIRQLFAVAYANTNIRTCLLSSNISNSYVF